MFSLANVNLERETVIETWSRLRVEISEMEKNSYLCCLCQVPGNLRSSLGSGRAYGSSQWEREGERGHLWESKWFWWKKNGPFGEQRDDLHLWPCLSGCAVWFVTMTVSVWVCRPRGSSLWGWESIFLGWWNFWGKGFMTSEFFLFLGVGGGSVFRQVREGHRKSLPHLLILKCFGLKIIHMPAPTLQAPFSVLPRRQRNHHPAR